MADPEQEETCPVCGEGKAEVDLEVLNLSADESAILRTCLFCATDIADSMLVHIRVDADDVLYATLGAVGGSEEETQ